jgi:hypothetical protein
MKACCFTGLNKWKRPGAHGRLNVLGALVVFYEPYTLRKLRHDVVKGSMTTPVALLLSQYI